MSGFQIVTTPNKGRALFATKVFNEGDVVITEAPLVSCQFAWNEAYQYLACEHCLRPLETAEMNAKRLTNDQSIALPYPECCVTVPWLMRHTKCLNCHTRYCSDECRSEAAAKYHSYLCQLGQHPRFQPLLEAWKQIHFPPETASIMLIIKLLAMYKQAANKDAFLTQLNDFQQTGTSEDTRVFHKMLGDKFATQMETLYNELKQLIAEDAELREWLNECTFMRLFLLIGTNGQGIGTTAVGAWAKRVEQLEGLAEGEMKNLEQAIDDLYVKMDEHSGQFLNVEGSGLYPQAKLLNHSCLPNCEMQFPHSNHVIQVTALRTIQVGEELCISYLDECAYTRSRHSRQKILRENYLFECQCEKCNAEIGQEDKTSSEDEEDDCDEEM